MSVLKDALAFLTEQAKQAAKGSCEDHGHYRMVWLPNGSYEQLSAVLKPRDHVCACLESLAALVQEEGQATMVWVGHTEITAVLGNDPRQGTARLPLPESRQLQALRANAARPLDQRAFVRFLRMDLDLPAETIAPYRALNWTAGAKAAGATKHGQESLGREVYAELTNAADVPERIVLHLPLYDAMGQRERASIACNVDIDTTGQTLRLDPAPGDIQMALDEHARRNEVRLRDLLGDAETEVYLGHAGKWTAV